ncbi:MAG: hypothetical protein SH809_18480 [Rhodothermales bacterium]|nr:hypothetical protein [Rhodothermales bacterium]
MTDSSPEAVTVQMEIFRRMPGAQKVRVAMELSERVRKLACARLRSTHPEWTERQVMLELIRITHGIVVEIPEPR